MNFIENNFIAGGYQFMSVLSLELIIATAWIIYQFVKGYRSKQANKEKILRMIGYGKSIGLFAMVTGFLGQMIGFIAMFEAIQSAVEKGNEIKAHLVYGGIRVTMISATYGVLIFLFTMILWFIASFIIEKKIQN
jgi:hypothetical protein